MSARAKLLLVLPSVSPARLTPLLYVVTPPVNILAPPHTAKPQVHVDTHYSSDRGAMGFFLELSEVLLRSKRPALQICVSNVHLGPFGV